MADPAWILKNILENEKPNKYLILRHARGRWTPLRKAVWLLEFHSSPLLPMQNSFYSLKKNEAKGTSASL